MSCSACFSEFGIFRKEVTCQTCGFSFCPKCCCKRSLVAKTGDTSKRQLCFKCFNNISENCEIKSPHSPPLAYKKRLEKMKNRSLSVGSGSSSLQNEKDREIVERLQRLKRDRAKEIIPSQGDLEERLAKLKGIDPSKYTAPPIQVFRPDRRTSIEQAADLMMQIQEEVDIDKKRIKPEDEIATRLARLKGEPVPVKSMEESIFPCTLSGLLNSPQTEMDIDIENQNLTKEQRISESEAMKDIQNLHRNPEIKQVLENPPMTKDKENSDSDIDEDAEADKLIEKLLATDLDGVAMDDPEMLNETNVQSTSSDKTPDEVPVEEFPWCVLCNENASIRCFGCDSDLYCMSCFKECHDDFDVKDHKTCPFICPKVG